MAAGSASKSFQLAIPLAWVAGCVDAIGYLVLFRLFTANMSGNSVIAGVSVGLGDWDAALLRIAPVVLFVAGVALGALVIEGAARRGVHSSFAIAIALEAAMLGAFMAYGGRWLRAAGALQVDTAWQFYALLALMTVAMGVQTAALQRVGGRRVRTTYVTGTLTALVEQLISYLLQRTDPGEPRAPASPGVLLPRPSRVELLLLAGIWAGYFFGAIVGGFTQVHWQSDSLVLPLCVLVALIVFDLVEPIYDLRAVRP